MTGPTSDILNSNDRSNSGHSWRAIAAEIQTVFENGIPLTSGVLHYIETTIGHLDTATLIEAINQDTDGTAESLLELLFTPELDIRLRIEPLLHTHRFDSLDERRIFEYLQTACPQTRFIFPDTRPPLCLKTPAPCLRLFISRLSICKQIHADLKTAVAAHVEPKIASLVLVKLRLSAFDVTPTFMNFLKALLEKLPSGHSLFLSCLNFCLDRRTGLHRTDDPYRDLTRLKERNEMILDQSIAFEKTVSDQTIEIRMLQGIRPPAVNRENLAADLRCIETICCFVFGRIEAAVEGNIPQQQELRVSLSDIQTLLDTLS